MPEHKAGKKNRKYGRNKNYCEKYLKLNKAIKNKELKVIRHSLKHPNDKTISGTIPDYKIVKFTTTFMKIRHKQEFIVNKRWKEYLKGVI